MFSMSFILLVVIGAVIIVGIILALIALLR